MDKCVRIAVALAITSHIVTGRSYIPDVRHKEPHRGYDYPVPHHHPPGRWHHDQDWDQSGSSSGSYGRPASYQKDHKPYKHPHHDKDWSPHDSHSSDSSGSDWESGSWEYPDYPGHGSPEWNHHGWGHGHGHGNQHQQWPQNPQWPPHQQWPQQQPDSDWSNRPTRDQQQPTNTGATNPQTSPRATTDASQDLLAQTVCIRSCPVTSEYNPVCGSNNVTYSNPGRLECAKFCGVDVNLARNSACPRPTFDASQTTTTSRPTTTTTVRPPLFVTPTRFTTVEIPATAPTNSPPQTNPPITISPDILNSIFTTPDSPTVPAATDDDQYEIDIRTRSRFRY